MKIIVTKYLNVRVGKPSLNAPCYQYLAPGSELEVDGKLYPGDPFEGIDTWMKDEEGNYYWSGGLKNDPEEKNETTDLPTHLINYNDLILTIPHDWKITNGRRINVAVFDTGVNASHRDFNGIFNTTNTINFTTGTTGVNDIYNHGTHVAGIIGARTTAINGIIGVAPECNLFILKVGEDDGDFLPANIINALNWATTNNIHIINMSFSINYTRYKSIMDTLNTISNCIIVAAAGENELLTQSNFFYPAMHPQIISVGAIDQPVSASFNKELNYILPLIPIISCSAPDQSSYKSESGSSMSAAFMTGVIALYLSYIRKNNVPKATIIEALNKYAFAYNSTIKLDQLLIIKP